MDCISLKNIRVYAHHGCLEEETRIGSDYLVHLEVYANLHTAAASDSLSDTVDYVHLNRIVKEEMAVPAALLEHVAMRINKRVLKELPLVMNVQTEVVKINPPIGGDVAEVCVKMSANR